MDKDEQKSQSAQPKGGQALREEKILEFWKENNIFQKSLDKKSPKGEYIFYEGPPTANGKPGIHHLEARAFKDAIPRYKTMQGFHVRRKGGWDTHGLPVELQVEKKLGLDSKKAIEEYGIAKFNKECKESVWEYTDLWSNFTERIGYWVDQKSAYVTYHNNYIESVWNVLKKVNDQKLLYKDYKVVPWCPRCGTTLSSHELAQGYQDDKDLSVTVKFKVKGQENTFILAWTTTPWTLPGNVALAVGKDIEYVKVRCIKKLPLALNPIDVVPPSGNVSKVEFFILAKDRFNSQIKFFEENFAVFEISENFKGSDLVDLEYEPLYPYLSENISDSEKGKLKQAFKVYDADFVTTEDGTGVVHIAPMYGVDDFNVGTKFGLPKHHLVGLDGKYLSSTGFLEGRFVKDEEVAVGIIKDLAHRGLLFKKEKYEHSYPHCWRCKTALIYYARDSWYIRMTDLRDKMVKENENINWEPSYIKEGRFGEWLRDIKDWAISRERYWGSPLPVWICDKCQKVEVIGSVDEIKLKTKKSGNKYLLMRHGEAENNILNVVSCRADSPHHLTEKGKLQILESVNKIKDIKFDYVFCSPFMRTKETLDILKNELKFDIPITIDERLSEYNVGDCEGKSVDEYHKLFPNKSDEFIKTFTNGETLNDLKRRVASFLEEIESKYKDKKILIISHGDAIWMIEAVNEGMDKEQALEFSKDNYLKNAEIKEFIFTPLPHNENYELDLHKPYIDEVALVCDCGGKLTRTKEVMDVWFDSGCMPFAQDHYPFENKELVDNGGYPADFISEAIDQTRGWFYTLHAVGVLMGKGKAYKNVICLGHLLDASGKKMSKSLGNIVDPWIMIEKYGVDTLRLWMYSVNQPGESKNFDEKTVAELHNKVFNLFYNVFAFYELYRDKELEKLEYKKSENVLDQWIIARLNQLIENTTKNMDNYKLLEPVRDIREFIDDLSTWYVRRSRERLKDGDVVAKKTLYYVLKNLAKLIAPFAPFTAEDIYLKLKTENDVESVHLAVWPKKSALNNLLSKISSKENHILEEMNQVRELVTLGLEARQKANIKVRQPLTLLKVKDLKLNNEYVEILKDELNVKDIIFDNTISNKVELDTYITEDLKQEGQYRELIRAVQDMRKKKGLNPNDVVNILIETSVEGQELINKFKDEFLKTASAKEIQIKENEGVEIKIDELVFIISID